MSSEPSAHIGIRAESEWTEITVSDAGHRLIAHGLGTLDRDVAPGIYRIEYRAGPALETEHVAIAAGRDYVPEPVALDIPAAAPVARTSTFDARHADAVARHSEQLASSPTERGLLVMVRTTAGRDSPVRPEAVNDVTVNGTRLDWEHAPDNGFAVWSTTELRRGIALRAPRDNLTAGLEPVLEQPLWLSPGWQTLVFVPCGARGPAWADASIHVVPMASVWNGHAPGAVAVEGLLARLITTAGPPPADVASLLIGELRENPMAGILLAHLLLADETARHEQRTSDLIGSLARLLPDHPDTRALLWLDPARGTARPRAIDWPPMLDLAYEAIEDLDAREPGVLRDGSASVRLSARRFREGLWTAWHPDGPGLVDDAGVSLPGVTARFKDPATQRVALHLERVLERASKGAGDSRREDVAALPSERVADVAYHTGLPGAAVARALTDIEAAIEPDAEPVPAPAPSEQHAQPEDDIRVERLLSILLRLSALGFVAAAAVLALPLDWEGAGALAAVAIFMRSVLLGGLCGLAGSDVRRFGALCQFIFVAIVVEIVLIGIVVRVAAPQADVGAAGVELRADVALAVWALADALWAGVIWSLWRRAFRARWHAEVLTPGNHRTLAAVSELLRDEPRAVRPAEVATNADAYLAAAEGRHRFIARTSLLVVALLPLARGRAPLSLVPPGDRRRLLIRALGPRMAPGARAATRTAHQLAALGYYADPRAAEELGVPADLAASPLRRRRPAIRTLDPQQVDAELEVDAVVVGSGPPGALMAYRLAEQGLHTLIVERGAAVDPMMRSDGVLQTVPEVLADGGFELLRAAQTKVLEVSCLGGRSIAQAGVWASATPAIAQRWNEPSIGAGLDASRFEAAWERVREWLPGADAASEEFSGGATRLLGAMEALDLIPEAPAPPGPLHEDGRPAELSKRSQAVLDTLIPWGQRRFGDRLQTLTGCTAQKVVLRKGHVTGVECKLAGRNLRVKAHTVVLSAGALGSGQLLRRSGVGGLGRRFSFDLATTLIADFAEPALPAAGAQLMASMDPSDPSFVVETVALPLWLQAMTMPGLFEQHAANMRRLQHLVSVRVHIGVDRGKKVRLPYSDRPRSAELEPEELARLMQRVKTTGELLFAAGAARLLPATVDYREIVSHEDLESLTNVRRSADIAVSARPQGGAPIGSDASSGVVDPDLRVYGTDGLYVCDASVFPTSVARAPMLTSMALAEYAAERIDGAPRNARGHAGRSASRRDG